MPIAISLRRMIDTIHRCMVLSLLAAAIAGCAVGPNFHRPKAPTDAGYTAAPLPQTTSSSSGLGGDAQTFVMGQDVSFKWWEAFGSAAIDSLVEKSFRANPTVKSAQAALKQAQELVYAQQGYFFPSVGADYNFERQKVAGNLGGNDPGPQGNGTVIQPQAPAEIGRAHV